MNCFTGMVTSVTMSQNSTTSSERLRPANNLAPIANTRGALRTPLRRPVTVLIYILRMRHGTVSPHRAWLVRQDKYAFNAPAAPSAHSSSAGLGPPGMQNIHGAAAKSCGAHHGRLPIPIEAY